MSKKTVEEWVIEHVQWAEKRIAEGYTDKLSTCSEWEQGLYDRDSINTYLAIKPAINILRNKGYNISTSYNHGVTDYLISKSVDIAKIESMINKLVEVKPEAKEKRVYVVNADNDEEFNYREAEHRGDFEAIKQHAEMTGLVYSLQGFQNACNNEEMDIANSFILID